MPDLNAAIRERLEDWVQNALDPQSPASALLTIAAMHAPGVTTGNYGYVTCAGCPNDTPHTECPELLAIAKGLGIEVASGPDDIRVRLEELWATSDGMIEILRSPELLPAVFSEAARADGTTLAFISAYRRIYERRSEGKIDA